jgi:hypothetical protein
MMMLEDLRLALRQICQAIGIQGNAASVVSLVVLGVALNLIALRAVEYAGIGGHRSHDRTVLQGAAQTEVKVVRTVAKSALKILGEGGRRLCLARQRMLGQQKGTEHRIEVGRDLTAPAAGGGCDTIVVSRFSRKMAVAPVQC